MEVVEGAYDVRKGTIGGGGGSCKGGQSGSGFEGKAVRKAV